MSRFYSNFQEFSDSLDRDLSWRKHELYLLKNAIPSQVGKKQQTFLRTAIPILYAHWEGFVNNAATNYLKYVKSRRLKHSELKPQFITLSLRKKLDLLEAKDIEKQTKIVQFVLKSINDRANIPYKNIINTKSNLTYKVFVKILFLIGIDETYFTRYQSIIDDLVDLRNYIAHGEDKSLDIETFSNFYDEVIALMNLFKTHLENSAVNEEYKKEIV